MSIREEAEYEYGLEIINKAYDEKEEAEWNSKIASAATKTNEIYSNYVGNKKKILPWIAKCMMKEDVLSYPHFIDLFGGSGNCAYFFSQLGKTGYINELLYYSHNMHQCMFSGYKQPISPLSDEELIPVGVTFIEYENISLFDTGAKKAKSMINKNDMFASDTDLVNSYNTEMVSVGVKFKSENKVFDNFWKVIKPYIGRNLTGKEGFEICCYLTNAIINGKSDYNKFATKVRALHGDSVGFINAIADGSFLLDQKNSFIYLDPPYGADNSNNKYYKIYDFMECISHAFYTIEECYAKYQETDSEKEIITWKTLPDIIELSHDIDKLDHIQKYAGRFSGSAQFKKSFFQLLDGLKKTKLPVWIFSFGGDASFVSTNEIAVILQKYCHHVAVYSVDYNYSYRKKQENTKSMAGMTIGVDADNEAGKKMTTDTEVLFICKR